MTFHFGVNFLDGFEPLLTWQNEVWMDDCVLGVEVLLNQNYDTTNPLIVKFLRIVIISYLQTICKRIADF